MLSLPAIPFSKGGETGRNYRAQWLQLSKSDEIGSPKLEIESLDAARQHAAR